MASDVPGSAGRSAGWWVREDAATWFGTTSLREAAALGRRVAELAGPVDVDLRADGLRVRLPDDGPLAAVASAALDLGLVADPTALQEVRVVVESPDPSAVGAFWQRALGYESGGTGVLRDPLRRDPSFLLLTSTDPRPLRNRVHVDVVRPAEVVGRADLGAASGPYGVCHRDVDGNEVDLVPGGDLDETGTTPDWQAVFGAVACYRVTSPGQQQALAAAVADVADEAGFPLLVDLRPGLVVLDTGKDQWEADAHGLAVDFVALARELQSAARGLGAVAELDRPRLTQLVLDAADVPAVRAFWTAALGYRPDRRTGATDIVDPRRLGPVLLFQDLDTADIARVRQRNRIHVELAVPQEVAAARVAAALRAGGRVLDEAPGRRRLADPEGNELVVVA